MSEYHKEDGGLYFEPTDKQLINDYLFPKINEGREFDFIWNMDVYANEPWLLKHNMNPIFKKYEWYYFVTRTQVSENNIGYGKNAKRKIIGDNGNWQGNAKEEILDGETRKPIGIKQTLTFSKSNNKKQKTEDGTSATVPGSLSSWTMTEYMLLPKKDEFKGLDKFQCQVLCKIHEIKKSKNNEDDQYEASASTSTYYLQHHDRRYHVSSSSEQQPINDHEYALDSSLEQKPISINCKIQENEKDDHENPIPHHQEFGPALSSKNQPINEAHCHDLEIPSMGTEKNDQVIKSHDETATEKERNTEESDLERFEDMGTEKDNRLHINAPRSCGCVQKKKLKRNKNLKKIKQAGSEKDEDEDEDEEEDQRGWLRDFPALLLRENRWVLPEETDGVLINDTTSFLDPDMFEQFAALRPHE